jgi:hypothetical protein
LISGSIYDCENPLIPSVYRRVIIGSLRSIADFEQDPTDTNVITAITLKDGDLCYSFDGVKNSISPSIELREATLANTYVHALALSIFEVDSAQKQNIEAMALDQMFAIVENANDSSYGDSIFEIYGFNGMEVNELTRTPSDPDTAGAYVMNMQTPEAYGGESRLPLTFDAGGYEATLAAVEALLVPPVPPL